MADASIWDSVFAGSATETAGFLALLSNPTLSKLLVHSELPPPAVLDFAVSLTFQRRMGSRVIKQFLQSFLQAQVIKDRKRALELVELYQARRVAKEEED
jgi:hypothetical protein